MAGPTNSTTVGTDTRLRMPGLLTSFDLPNPDVHARTWRCGLTHCDCCQRDRRDAAARVKTLCTGCGAVLCEACASSCSSVHDDPADVGHQHVDGS